MEDFAGAQIIPFPQRRVPEPALPEPNALEAALADQADALAAWAEAVETLTARLKAAAPVQPRRP